MFADLVDQGLRTGETRMRTNRATSGYWVGYRIVKSYQHASDKRQAFREILQMTDPKAFLAKSGWYPGIHLD
jgi:uncharacterized protein YjaZ